MFLARFADSRSRSLGDFDGVTTPHGWFLSVIEIPFRCSFQKCGIRWGLFEIVVSLLLLGKVMKKSSYDKRLFGLAESLIRDIERADKPIQPEDVMLWIQTHVPRTESEDKEFEEELAEMMPDRKSPGRSSINELRQALGFTDEMSLLSVIRTAAETIQRLRTLDDDLRWILSRPNFWCIGPAAVLRADGKEIKTRAEDEQASVIHWLLNLYITHGRGFEEVMKSEAKRIKEKAVAAAVAAEE